MMSVNHKVICKPYAGDRKPQAQIRNGLATVKQRTAVVALRVLVDARITDTLTIKKDSLVHIHEAHLASNQTVNTVLESDEVGQPFVAINFGDIIFISEA